MIVFAWSSPAFRWICITTTDIFLHISPLIHLLSFPLLLDICLVVMIDHSAWTNQPSRMCLWTLLKTQQMVVQIKRWNICGSGWMILTISESPLKVSSNWEVMWCCVSYCSCSWHAHARWNAETITSRQTDESGARLYISTSPTKSLQCRTQEFLIAHYYQIVSVMLLVGTLSFFLVKR